MESAEALVRVVRGQVNDEELAALVTVLFALCATGQGPDGKLSGSGAGWWRQPDAYAAPGGWR